MKSSPFWRSVCVCGVMGAVLYSSGATASAQLPPSTTSRETVSATGCVERETPAEKTADGGSLDGAFMLRGVKVGPSLGLAERPALPPGTPASSEGSQATNTAEPGSGAPPRDARAAGADIAGAQRDSGLRLVADRGVDLAEHVGHRVLVTGRLSSFAAPGGVASTAAGRTLTVTKVSLISSGCTAGS
jgi:hypothetical protein